MAAHHVVERRAADGSQAKNQLIQRFDGQHGAGERNALQTRQGASQAPQHVPGIARQAASHAQREAVDAPQHRGQAFFRDAIRDETIEQRLDRRAFLRSSLRRGLAAAAARNDPEPAERVDDCG